MDILTKFCILTELVGKAIEEMEYLKNMPYYIVLIISKISLLQLALQVEEKQPCLLVKGNTVCAVESSRVFIVTGRR